MIAPEGQINEFRMTLAQEEGGELTGTVTPEGGDDLTIQEGRIQEEALSFTIARERQGRTIFQKFSGTMTGDAIQGTVESERGGQTQSRGWEARRER
jgi:hypothetical protein